MKEISSINQLIDIANHCFVSLIIPKSKSKYYDLVVSMCESADYHGEVMIKNDRLILAAYNQSTASLKRLNMVLRYSSDWKGLICYAGKFEVRARLVWLMIHCYTESLKCRDPTAYCCTIIDNPFEYHGPRYILPCQRLRPWVHQFQHDHPSKPIDRCQALAVENGCDFCPHFHLENFKPLKVFSIPRRLTFKK